MGRPTLYSPELLESICERLAQGEALATVCRSPGMPSVRTFLQWADEKEDVAAAYSRALAARAEWFTAEHDRIRQTAVDRETAAAARVQLTALEWQMSKMAPKRFGDRLDVSVEHSVDLGAVLDKARQRLLEARREVPGQLGVHTPPSLPQGPQGALE
jgi:hypothetical protein